MRHANPSILALDLGTKTGWALYSEGEVISSTFDMVPRNGEGVGIRFLRFRREFLNNFKNVREVYFEEVRRHEGTHAAHIYGGLWATLCAWCEENTIPYHGLEVAQIKKHVTGKGNANKAQMVAAMRERGYKPIDDNEADALAILSFARKQRAI
jgi:hypothetical protein